MVNIQSGLGLTQQLPISFAFPLLYTLNRWLNPVVVSIFLTILSPGSLNVMSMLNEVG